MGVNPRICYGVKSGTQGVSMALVCVYEMSQDEEQLRAFSVSVITQQLNLVKRLITEAYFSKNLTGPWDPHVPSGRVTMPDVPLSR